MSEGQDPKYPPPTAFSERAHFGSLERYSREYQRSIEPPETFWAEKAERLDWIKPWDKVGEWDFAEPSISWFEGGQLNASVNCLDRHIEAGRGEDVAIIWEGNDPSESKSLTYRELHAEVCRFASGLRSIGVKKGDRVCIYLPMVIELAVSLLACARIGAVHSVVFGGFSADSLRTRILDSSCSVVVTANEGLRGSKTIPLKGITDEAVEGLECVRNCIVVERTSKEVVMTDGRDLWWHDLVADQGGDCEPEVMEAEDPLFILYTSGSTGKPKGVLHSTAGYLLYTSLTHEIVFDYHPGDIYWCTADIGWITGHSYIVYGPLANGATTLMFEGIPNYPDHGRFWDVVEKYGVNIFYTAPTAIRALMREGTEWTASHEMPSLRLLGTVGEPINPEAWRWYHENVGKGRCPIVDTWWQTETGGILITPVPGAIETKPGSATLPFFGVQPVLVDDEGKELEGEASGNLCIRHPWPSIMRTVYGDHERFKKVYFSQFPGKYFTGDGCRRDEDGYYWFVGRSNDMFKVRGMWVAPVEVENELLGHPSVLECAVVDAPDARGLMQAKAVVVTREGQESGDALAAELRNHLAGRVAPFKVPTIWAFVHALPRTATGKVQRFALRG